MAAPPEVTIKNLQGKFEMSKRLSDDPDAFFILQGLSWLTRKAVGLATVVLTIRTYEEEGETHVDIMSVASGLSTTNEHRVLNWNERDHEDRVFGKVKGHSRYFKLDEFQPGMEIEEADKNFLLGKQLKDGTPSAFTGDDDHIQTLAISQNDGWTVDQVWGFEDVDGTRRYTRRLVARKGAESQQMRLVYEYLGPASE